MLNGRDKFDLQKSAKVLLTGYLIGIAFMPGAHFQFQFWFIPIVPLVLALTGLPVILTFWIPYYFYPLDFEFE